jgi:hypothetical protein
LGEDLTDQLVFVSKHPRVQTFLALLDRSELCRETWQRRQETESPACPAKRLVYWVIAKAWDDPNGRCLDLVQVHDDDLDSESD